MPFRIAVAISFFALVLGGCAGVPQASVPFSPAKIADPAVRVGVAMAPLPKVDTYFPGADCLLCLAAASVANSSLTSYTQTLRGDDLSNVKVEIADLLRKKGANVKMIAEDIRIADLPSARVEGPNLAKKDYTSLRNKYEVDKLVVINIVNLGMWRTYSAYFPTSEPKAVVSGEGFMVNLTDNSYDWFTRISIFRSAEGKWDEPSTFPGLTNAYFQAVEVAKDSLKKPFTE